MEFAPLASFIFTVGTGFLFYRMTSVSLGADSQYWDKRDRFHKSTYYSDYANPQEFIDHLKLPPVDPNHKPMVYLRQIPGARKYEMDIGMGAYFIIDERQHTELLNYKQNFQLRYEKTTEHPKSLGKPTISNLPEDRAVSLKSNNKAAPFPDYRQWLKDHSSQGGHIGSNTETSGVMLPPTAGLWHEQLKQVQI